MSNIRFWQPFCCCVSSLVLSSLTRCSGLCFHVRAISVLQRLCTRWALDSWERLINACRKSGLIICSQNRALRSLTYTLISSGVQGTVSSQDSQTCAGLWHWSFQRFRPWLDHFQSSTLWWEAKSSRLTLKQDIGLVMAIQGRVRSSNGSFSQFHTHYSTGSLELEGFLMLFDSLHHNTVWTDVLLRRTAQLKSV